MLKMLVVEKLINCHFNKKTWHDFHYNFDCEANKTWLSSSAFAISEPKSREWVLGWLLNDDTAYMIFFSIGL